MQSEKIRFFKSEAREIILSRGNYPKIFISCILFFLLNIGAVHLLQSVCLICGVDIEGKYEFTFQYASFVLYFLIVMPAGAGVYLSALSASVSSGVFPSPSALLIPFSCKKTLLRIYRCYFAYLWRFSFLFGLAFAGFYAANHIFESFTADGLFLTGFIFAIFICILTYFVLCLFFLLFSSIYPLLTLVLKRQDISIKNAKKHCKKIMRAHRFELFELQSSFILLFLFSAATFGILYVLYTLPYFLLTNALYSSYLTDTKI